MKGPISAQTRRKLIAATVGVQTVLLGGAWLATQHELRWFSGRWKSHVAEGPAENAAPPSGASVASALSAAAVLALTTLSLGILIRRYDTAVAAHARKLEGEVAARVAQALAARHALILGLARMADHRDSDTGEHLDRICQYAGILARRIRAQDPAITDQWIANLELAASLHDIGKVGIPDAVLLKPGPLAPDERRLMQTHTLIGAQTLAAVRERLGDDPLLDMSIVVARHHHERWDGLGYPDGLIEEQIPPAARIVALADFYDAVTSRRVYKAAMGHDQAVEMIRAARGTRFEPRLVDAFIQVQGQFEAVRSASDGRRPPPLPAPPRRRRGRAGQRAFEPVAVL